MKWAHGFWAVVGLSLLFRGVLLVCIGNSPTYAFVPDSVSYVEPAQALSHHLGFSTLKDGRRVPELYRTPGYPLYLTLFLTGQDAVHHKAIQWSQAVLNAFSSGLVYLAALAFWKNRNAALAAGIGFGLDFVNAMHCAFILTDILFVFWVALTLLLIIRHRFMAAGLAAAAAALVRPIGVYYPIFLALAWVLSYVDKKRGVTLKQVGIFFLAAMIPLTAWVVRNGRETHHWTFSTLQDANMYLVRTALVEMEREHISYENALVNIQKSRQTAPQAVPDGRWATSFLVAHWQDYARVMINDLIKLLAGNSMKVAAWALLQDDHYNPFTIPTHAEQSPLAQERELAHRHPGLEVFLVLYLLFLAATYGLALVGFWVAGHRYGWNETLMVSSSILYYAAITLGADAQARYRLPMMPALFVLAAGGWERFFRRPS